jgi:hypothetical protein
LKSAEILSIGLALLVRQIVHLQAIGTTKTFTLNDLKERLTRLLKTPGEQYQSYTLIIEDAVFNKHEIEILLRHAASQLLVDGDNLHVDQVASLVKARLELDHSNSTRKLTSLSVENGR